MNHRNRILPLATLALLSALFCSCGTSTTRTAGSSFSFKPTVVKPTSRSAVSVKISTGAQRLYVMEGDKMLLATPCRVGKSATPTPKGNFRIDSKSRQRRRQSAPGAGYPMTYWMSFYSPSYGMHWGFVKPYPSTAGCIRLPLNSAREIFDMVNVGTPVNVSSSQPWDSTVGAALPRLDDTPLPNPPMSYLLSPKVFQDAEQGKMWDF
ncbi:MAG: L,D-transpeptidase [Verrucomicrobia bacterium]|nr:L,D-transpeptidase [Verrucomicrobiota bacterium]MDA1007222.1 L,D-transpeptidase [Verrucomicrobiota bacterium]